MFLCKFILEIRVSFKLGLDVYIFVKGQVTVKVGEYLCVCVKKKKKNRRKNKSALADPSRCCDENSESIPLCYGDKMMS